MDTAVRGMERRAARLRAALERGLLARLREPAPPRRRVGGVLLHRLAVLVCVQLVGLPTASRASEPGQTLRDG